MWHGQVLVEHPEQFLQHIKQCLSSKEGIPVKQQRLVFSGPGAQLLGEAQESSQQQPAVEEILSSLNQWQVCPACSMLSQQVQRIGQERGLREHCCGVLANTRLQALACIGRRVSISVDTLSSCLAMCSTLDRCKSSVADMVVLMQLYGVARCYQFIWRPLTVGFGPLWLAQCKMGSDADSHPVICRRSSSRTGGPLAGL